MLSSKLVVIIVVQRIIKMKMQTCLLFVFVFMFRALEVSIMTSDNDFDKGILHGQPLFLHFLVTIV